MSMSTVMTPPMPRARHMAKASRASLTVPTQSVGLWLSSPSILRRMVLFSGRSKRLTAMVAATVSGGSQAA